MRYLLILLFCFAASGQTIVFGGGNGAATVVRLNGTTLPASCNGRVLFDLTTDDGSNGKGLYHCDGGTYSKIGPFTGTVAATGAYSATFASSDTWTLAGATHGLGTCDVMVGVLEDDSGKWKKLDPGSWDCDPRAGANQYDVVVRFAVAQAGRLVVLKSGGGGVGGGASDFSELTGTAAVNQGGTGATTEAGARTNLLPSKTGNSLKVLRVNAGETDYELAEVSSSGGGDVTSLRVTGTLSSWGTIAAASCVEKNLSLLGAVSGDNIAPGWPSTLEAGILGVMLPGSDVVVVRLCNVTGSGVAVADGQTFTAMILRSTL